MSLFAKLKRIKPIKPSIPNTFISQIEYKNVSIEIEYYIDESKKHLSEDYAILQKEGIDDIIKKYFIPWLKADIYIDKDDNLIYEGLEIYGITYQYGMIGAHYLPSEKEEMIGRFDFFFKSGSEYTADMLESVAMQIYILNGKIVKVDGYEV
ncbi:MAG: hypothetical protein IJZ96_09170 [Lachnospiraceae bacterium]|nr:hypothetical protein [Lachnospiraceae bacterium]